MNLPSAKPLETIFAISNPSELALELRQHCFAKEIKNKQSLTNAEVVFDSLARYGGRIAGDGFVSVFHEFFTPLSFAQVCDALTEVGADNLRNLLREAWNIYTKENSQITAGELRDISVRRFNTKEKMVRFDQLGDEIMKEIEQQYTVGKVWSVEYAKRHRDEFQPIEGLAMEQRPAVPKSPPPLPASSQPIPPSLPYLGGHKFRNPISRQVKHPNDIFAIKSEHQFLLALTLHGMVKQHELGMKLNHAESTLALLASLAGECYEDPVEKWLKGWSKEDLTAVITAICEGGALNTVELLEQAKHLLSGNSSDTKELARINKELHGASVAAELHKAQLAYARKHQTDFRPIDLS